MPYALCHDDHAKEDPENPNQCSKHLFLRSSLLVKVLIKSRLKSRKTQESLYLSFLKKLPKTVGNFSVNDKPRPIVFFAGKASFLKPFFMEQRIHSLNMENMLLW